ncbi:uncharacterized protein LOC116616159 [Nematostella vectensis]|uniref:uncharacterized protein LOC116616159 n=1 Tax=Nematostella vectensis TaxID=45351 RepID=UPI002077782F|nr:uncharacterized protein LOC116616159 [Nematostella vectensis]
MATKNFSILFTILFALYLFLIFHSAKGIFDNKDNVRKVGQTLEESVIDLVDESALAADKRSNFKIQQSLGKLPPHKKQSNGNNIVEVFQDNAGTTRSSVEGGFESELKGTERERKIRAITDYGVENHGNLRREIWTKRSLGSVAKGLGAPLKGRFMTVKKGKRKDLIQVSVVNENTGQALPVSMGTKKIDSNEWIPVNNEATHAHSSTNDAKDEKHNERDSSDKTLHTSGYLPIQQPLFASKNAADKKSISKSKIKGSLKNSLHKTEPEEEYYLALLPGSLKSFMATSEDTSHRQRNSALQKAWRNVVKRVFESTKAVPSRVLMRLRHQKVDPSQEELVAKSVTKPGTARMPSTARQRNQQTQSRATAGGIKMDTPKENTPAVMEQPSKTLAREKVNTQKEKQQNHVFLEAQNADWAAKHENLSPLGSKQEQFAQSDAFKTGPAEFRYSGTTDKPSKTQNSDNSNDTKPAHDNGGKPSTQATKNQHDSHPDSLTAIEHPVVIKQGLKNSKNSNGAKPARAQATANQQDSHPDGLAMEVNPVETKQGLQANIKIPGATKIEQQPPQITDESYSDSVDDYLPVAPMKVMRFDMSEWSPWSTCSSTCGRQALTIRTRQCLDTDTGKEIGLSAHVPCTGSLVEWRACKGLKPCKDSPNSVYVHPNPLPLWKGKPVAMETMKAPEVNPWSEWSSCSAPCGSERLKVRERKCAGKRLANGVCVKPTMQWAWCEPKQCTGSQPTETTMTDPGAAYLLGQENIQQSDEFRSNNTSDFNIEAPDGDQGGGQYSKEQQKAGQDNTVDMTQQHDRMGDPDAISSQPTEDTVKPMADKNRPTQTPKYRTTIKVIFPDKQRKKMKANIQDKTRQSTESQTNEYAPIADENSPRAEYLPIELPSVGHVASVGMSRVSDDGNPCKVSDWSKWSVCSQSCGAQATQTRSRKCTCVRGNQCPQGLVETRNCNLGACPAGIENSTNNEESAGHFEDSSGNSEGSAGIEVYGPWTGFTKCTKTCGGGWRKRTRRCHTTEPGKKCDQDLLIGIQVCNTQPCPKQRVIRPSHPPGMFGDMNPEPVCGFNPCEEFGCFNRNDAKCVTDTNCNPVFLDEYGSRIKQCKGWRGFYLKKPETMCGMDPCQESACLDDFGRCKVDLDCRPVVLGAENRVLSCNDIQQQRQQQQALTGGAGDGLRSAEEGMQYTGDEINEEEQGQQINFAGHGIKSAGQGIKTSEQRINFAGQGMKLPGHEINSEDQDVKSAEMAVEPAEQGQQIELMGLGTTGHGLITPSGLKLAPSGDYYESARYTGQLPETAGQEIGQTNLEPMTAGQYEPVSYTRQVMATSGQGNAGSNFFTIVRKKSKIGD